MPADTTALLVFIKNPVEGRVKTRLAATVGTAKALEVYHKLLAHTFAVANATKVAGLERKLYYSEPIGQVTFTNYQLPETGLALWSADGSVLGFVACVQSQVTDLGERMRAAFAETFEKTPSEGVPMPLAKVVIIGSDCLELQPHHLEAAFAALDSTDLVIGPAHDGGYYLLGMKQLHPTLFEGIVWSTDTVYRETMHRAAALGLRVAYLETLHDVDTEADWLASVATWNTLNIIDTKNKN